METRREPILSWAEYKSGKGIEPLSIRLPDFWWFCRRHLYGRSGHGYCCPLTFTVCLWLARLRGHQAYWIAEVPAWFEEDSDLYEPATPVVLDTSTLASTPFMRYTVPIEMWCDRWFNRICYRYNLRLYRSPFKPFEP